MKCNTCGWPSENGHDEYCPDIEGVPFNDAECGLQFMSLIKTGYDLTAIWQAEERAAK